MEDKVNHPKHYNNSKAHCTSCARRIECIDVTRHMGFNIGNVIKYLWRHEDKNGVEDLRKAQWYLNDLISSIDRDKAQRTVTTPWYQGNSDKMKIDRVDMIAGTTINPPFEIPESKL